MYEKNYFFFFYLQWILSYIEMKQPWVYMCSPSRTPLPSPSPPAPSRFSHCTRSEKQKTYTIISFRSKNAQFSYKQKTRISTKSTGNSVPSKGITQKIRKHLLQNLFLRANLGKSCLSNCQIQNTVTLVTMLYIISL